MCVCIYIMDPVPGRMRTLCTEKIAAKKSVFENFFSARVFASEKTRIWKRPLCIYVLPTFSLAKTQQKSRTWKSCLKLLGLENYGGPQVRNL